MNKDLFGYEDGDQLRDRGMGLAADANPEWMDNALAIIATIPRGTLLMGEDLRKWIPEQPKSGACWGALTGAAVRRKLLKGTGIYRKSASAINHSHHYQMYRKT